MFCAAILAGGIADVIKQEIKQPITSYIAFFILSRQFGTNYLLIKITQFKI